MSAVATLMMQFLGIVALPRAMSAVKPIRWLLPRVMVLLVIGIALGEEGLGRVSPEIHGLLFSAEALKGLSGLSVLAVVLFAFTIGTDVDPVAMRTDGKFISAVGIASLLVPLVIGACLGLVAFRTHGVLVGKSADLWLFAGAVGVCCAVTALPVLGALINDLGLDGTRLARIAISLAAVSDMFIWPALAALAVLSGGTALSMAGAAQQLIGVGALAVAFLFIFPRLNLGARAPDDGAGNDRIVLVFALLFAASLATELLHLHAVLGAFACGACLPRAMKDAAVRVTKPLCEMLLLPFYFVVSGTQVSVTAVISDPGFIAIAVMAMVIGKVAPVVAVGRLFGEGWRFLFALGALVQAKGLMEVVVLTILRDMGVISVHGYSCLLVAGIITTALSATFVRLSSWRDGSPSIQLGSPSATAEQIAS